MEIDIATICDAASCPPDGKLNILGAFDTIFYNSLPAFHPQFSIVFRLRVPEKEKTDYLKNKAFTLAILDPNKENLFEPIKSEVKVIAVEKVKRDIAIFNLIFNLGGVFFKKDGKYQIILQNKTKILKKLPFYLSKTISD
jgi:hypothetical protein